MLDAPQCHDGCRSAAQLEIILYTLTFAEHAQPFANLYHCHGEPEKETSFEDEQAQAQKALEIEPPQEANMAEVIE